MGNIFQVLLVQPILNIMVAVYDLLTYLHISYALGFSIIALTIIIRLILYPLTTSQLRTSKKMQELTPHINRLKTQHKSDAKRLQAETMALYKEHGVNPAAGCLPVVIQLPVIWALYYVLRNAIVFKLSDINKLVYTPSLKLHHLWSTDFFGLSLTQLPSHLIAHTGPLILLIPVLTGVLQFIQTKMMLPQKPAQTIAPAEKSTQDDFTAAFQSQSLFIFPIMIAFFSYSFPVGLSLYWNTLTFFGIIQQYHVQGLGGLRSFLPKQPQPVALPPVQEPVKTKKAKKKLYGR